MEFIVENSVRGLAGREHVRKPRRGRPVTDTFVATVGDMLGDVYTLTEPIPWNLLDDSS